MRFEHFALNVPDPRAMAQWYVDNLGAVVLRGLDEPPHTHFLADSDRRVMMEIYCNPDASVPDYAQMPPLSFHVAFATEDPEGARERTVGAGATLLSDKILEDGSRIIMLRDPWGVAFQFVCRSEPMI